MQRAPTVSLVFVKGGKLVMPLPNMVVCQQHADALNKTAPADKKVECKP